MRSALISTAEMAGEDRQPRKITHNVNDLLDTLIEQSVQLVGKPVALMSKDDKITAIQYLNDAGAFDYQIRRQGFQLFRNIQVHTLQLHGRRKRKQIIHIKHIK